MKSLIVLMMEEEQPEGLSARKLVAESAKHNVITAYNAPHGLEMLRRFPAVDAVLVHAGLLRKEPSLVDEIREVVGDVPVILANPMGADGLREIDTEGVNYVVDSHRPQELLQVLEDKIPSRSGLGVI